MINDVEESLKFFYKSRVRLSTIDIINSIEYFSLNKDVSSKQILIHLFDILRKIDALDDWPIKYKKELEKPIRDLALWLNSNFDFINEVNGYVLISLMRICYFNKYIYLAYKIREIAVKKISEIESGDNPFLIFEKIKAVAERSDTNDIDLSNIDRKYFHAAKNIGLYYNKRQDLIDENLYSKSDLDFKEYLSDKSIAIVGPISLGQLNGDEIDKFDIVLRFNYFGLNGYNKDEFGSNTHISYYLEKFVKNEPAKIAEYSSELDFIIHQKTSPVGTEAFKNVTTPSRSMLNIWGVSLNPYFLSNPNAVQKALFDILRFETGKIKVFNSNLFINKTINKAYSSASSNINESDFIWHDVFSQFIFTKRMYEYGIIEVDSVLESVLTLSIDEYALQMDKEHGRSLVGNT